jgi:RNA polymerase sigma-70 factor (ECF subfamily)
MSLAFRLVGSREEAEELVQDAFVRAFRNLEQFRGDASFGTWFYRILYNVCMTKVTRRRKAMDSIEDADLPLADHLADTETPGVLENMEQEELNRLIATEVDRLPSKLKSVVLLFYIQEMSYPEISAVTGLPIGTVKTYLHRGRNLLRKAVGSTFSDEVGT